jgi:hypothetical protein
MYLKQGLNPYNSKVPVHIGYSVVLFKRMRHQSGMKSESFT